MTAYTLDGLDNHLQTRSPDTGVTVSIYDAAGNEITHTDAKGQITRIAYDALNRPIHITYADGRQTRYTWDAGTYGVGRLSRIDEVENGSITGSHQYAYDAQGRLRQETRTFGARSHTTAYHYVGGDSSSICTSPVSISTRSLLLITISSVIMILFPGTICSPIPSDCTAESILMPMSKVIR